MWRVVSGYTESDIAAYYADATVVASGVQEYDWESPLLSETRHLDFNSDQHKILETELKMLYTAITRARVNIFIAETNIEQSRPMFNYFQRRCVVDVVNKGNDSSEGLSNVRVFGVEDNKPQEWLNRGEYYLKNAEGDRQVGCLRLAAKCFDRAGDEDRKKTALAYLAFVEIEEQEDNQKKRGRLAERKEKLYSITAQLLEAQDVDFLDKAALCLLRTGVHDLDAAKLFELYARLTYTQRMYDGVGLQLPLAPSIHERKFFGYAGKLFAKCCQRNPGLAFASFRNFVCAAMYHDAQILLSSGTLPLESGESFVELQNCLSPSDDGIKEDPIAYFQNKFESTDDECTELRESVKRAAAIGCRKLYKTDDSSGFFASLQLVPSSQRVRLLSSINEGNSGSALSKLPWATHHLFRKDKGKASRIDIANMLVSELESESKYREAAEMLENSGYLLEAAERYSKLSDDDDSPVLTSKATILRVRWVELTLLTSKWKDDRDTLSSRATLVAKDSSSIPKDTIYSSLVSKAMLGSVSDLYQTLDVQRVNHVAISLTESTH